MNEQMREFEEWAHKYGLDCCRVFRGTLRRYLYDETQYAFDAWLAARGEKV